MVLAVIWFEFVCPLQVLENFTLSMELWTNLYLSAAKLGIGDKFFFHQDNDPKHTSKLIQEYFIKNGIKRLETYY